MRKVSKTASPSSARRSSERDELLGGGDDVFIRKDGGAVGFHTDGINQQRIIGEVDYGAEGHARNAQRSDARVYEGNADGAVGVAGVGCD